MAERNEDCLDHIFRYLTPLEWIQISEVCQQWRIAVQRRWKKISEVILDTIIFNCSKSVLITTKEALKMVLHAAEFCKDVKLLSSCNEKDVFLLLNSQFIYKIENVNSDRVLQLLSKKATEITEIEFGFSPKPELLSQLFETNEIKLIRVEQSEDFWRNITANSVETVDVIFCDPKNNMESFNGRFLNLKTLKLVIICHEQDHTCILQILSLILPYVLGIKSLKLEIYVYSPTNVVLKDVIRCPQLEELSLSLEWSTGNEMTYLRLDELLETSCPKLRKIELWGVTISSDVLHSLLSLQHLDKLILGMSELSFHFAKALPEIKNLSDLSVDLIDETKSVVGLCYAVTIMPNLRRLYVNGFSDGQSLMLSCEAITAAAKQRKDITVVGISCGSRKLKIFHDDTILNLLLINMSQYSGDYFDDIIAFVQTNLKGLKTFISEDK